MHPPPAPPADPPRDPVPLEILARSLAGMLEASVLLILVWHVERGPRGAPVGTGLPIDDLVALGRLMQDAAPGLLPVLTGSRLPVAPGAPPLDGWDLDTRRQEARQRTRWGRLHVLAVPIDGAITLFGLIHAAPWLDLWGRYPLLRRLLADQVALALHADHLTARLADEARWMQAVLHQTTDGLALVDATGQIVGCNSACERITGWSAADLRGRDLVEVLQMRPMYWTGRSSDDEEAPWHGPLEADAPPSAPAEESAPPSQPRRVELVLTGRQGNQVYTEAAVVPVTDNAGTMLGAVVSLRDVTAQREAEELQATFLSVISHELQTPLAVIRGYAELLADGADTMAPTQLRRKLAVVAEESERLSKMVTDLLDASRIQAGGLELALEPVNIPRLVRHAVQKMELLSTNHQFLVAIPDDLPPVLADYDRVSQVLIILLDNAIKYSPRGGRITVTSDLRSAEVVLHISDEGIGVPEAERERIFSRFARLNSRVVRQMKGVGLGLYIARAIIRAHGGRIWVDPAPGGGAQFSFSLPREHKAPLPVLFSRG